MNSRHLLHAILVCFLAVASVAQNHLPRPQETSTPTPAVQQPPPAATPAPLEPLPQDANQYVRQIVERELAEQERDDSHWRYSLHREDDKGSQDRDVIETGEGSLSRTLLKFGRPLTADERAQDEARMRRQISDPAERAKHAKRERDDAQKAKNMLKAIPDAFIFQYDGEEDGLVRLAFTPNPHYNAPNRELQVFHSLRGKLWTNRAASRLARVEGSLFEDVTFGFGLLGRLNKGGSFMVVQQQVAPAHWEIVSLEIKMTGHAVIFKTINVRQLQRLTDFLRVSNSLTLRQAFEILQKEPNPVSAGTHAALNPQGKD